MTFEWCSLRQCYWRPIRRRWRPHVTNCAIVSHSSLLQAVLTAAIPWEACSLMVNAVASHARGRRFAPWTEKNLLFFLHFILQGSILLFSRSKIISLHFLKEVRCHVWSHSAFVLKWPVPIKRAKAHGQGFCPSIRPLEIKQGIINISLKNSRTYIEIQSNENVTNVN